MRLNIFSLRAIYGTDDQRNALHGSDSFSSAQREIRFFFPDSIVEPVATGQAAKDYLSKTVNPTLLKGLTQLCKEKPADPVVSNSICIKTFEYDTKGLFYSSLNTPHPNVFVYMCDEDFL